MRFKFFINDKNYQHFFGIDQTQFRPIHVPCRVLFHMTSSFLKLLLDLAPLLLHVQGTSNNLHYKHQAFCIHYHLVLFMLQYLLEHFCDNFFYSSTCNLKLGNPNAMQNETLKKDSWRLKDRLFPFPYLNWVA